jgi:hypothetical protein
MPLRSGVLGMQFERTFFIIPSVLNYKRFCCTGTLYLLEYENLEILESNAAASSFWKIYMGLNVRNKRTFGAKIQLL